MVTRVGVVAAELEEKWIDKERVLDPERKGLYQVNKPIGYLAFILNENKRS